MLFSDRRDDFEGRFDLFHVGIYLAFVRVAFLFRRPAQMRAFMEGFPAPFLGVVVATDARQPQHAAGAPEFRDAHEIVIDHSGAARLTLRHPRISLIVDAPLLVLLCYSSIFHITSWVVRPQNKAAQATALRAARGLLRYTSYPRASSALAVA